MDFSSIVNIVLGGITLIGFGFGIWQYKSASNLKKIVNDHVKGLYRDSQRILELAKGHKEYSTIEEKGRTLKYSIIRLDIVNRNLNIKEINKLNRRGIITKEEADEYKRLSSN
jgi:hypothetical protein